MAGDLHNLVTRVAELYELQLRPVDVGKLVRICQETLSSPKRRAGCTRPDEGEVAREAVVVFGAVRRHPRCVVDIVYDVSPAVLANRALGVRPVFEAYVTRRRFYLRWCCGIEVPEAYPGADFENFVTDLMEEFLGIVDPTACPTWPEPLWKEIVRATPAPAFSRVFRPSQRAEAWDPRRAPLAGFVGAVALPQRDNNHPREHAMDCRLVNRYGYTTVALKGNTERTELRSPRRLLANVDDDAQMMLVDTLVPMHPAEVALPTCVSWHEFDVDAHAEAVEARIRLVCGEGPASVFRAGLELERNGLRVTTPAIRARLGRPETPKTIYDWRAQAIRETRRFHDFLLEQGLLPDSLDNDVHAYRSQFNGGS